MGGEPTPGSANSARDELRQCFAEWSRSGVKLDQPRDRQLDLLVEVLLLYRRKGVVDGVTGLAPPVACANRRECWAGKKEFAKEGHPPIALPYIGPAYKPGGVAMLGMNLNDAGNLLGEFEITALNLQDLAKPLAKDERKSLGSMFAYRSARSARALIESRANVPVEDSGTAGELGEFVLATARLQSVKCGPRDKLAQQTSPYPCMYKYCRELYLLDELDILRPGALLAFGVAVSDQVLRHLCPDTLTTEGDGVVRGTLTRDWGVIDVYRIFHPSRPPWQRSHRRFVELLRRDPALTWA
jgi:hypothetical protein